MDDTRLKHILGVISNARPADVYVTTKSQLDHAEARWTVRSRHATGDNRIVTDDQLKAIVRELLVLRAYRREMTAAQASVRKAGSK